MPRVLISAERLREQPGAHVDLLRQAGFEFAFPKDPHFARGLGSDEASIAELAGFDATMASGENYTRRILQACPRLKVIARTGVGYDRVDVAAATELGIAVTITPNSNHEAVAEFALALLFAVAKSIVSNDRQVRQGRWPRELVAPLRRCTLGILGLGRIGRSTAVRAAALGMKVIATENAPDLEFARRNSIRLVDFETLLRDSDFLSLHCPLGDETRGLLNRDAFAKMKKGSVLINTARGKLVVEADLVEALKSRHLAGAGLDVYELEPPAASNPLFQLEQVVLSPHVAGTDHASSAQMSVDAAECIVALFRGDWPEGCVVNEELRGRWVQQ